MAESEQKNCAAYMPWGTFTNALDRLALAVPTVIDRTVFNGMAWALQSQLLAGMRFLGLIDDRGTPSPTLEDLATVDESHRKAKLREILHNRYPLLFALDLKKTTPGQLEQKMGDAYGVSGATRVKAVRFFLSAAKYSGIPLSPLFGSIGTTTKRTSGAPRRKRSRNRLQQKEAILPDEQSGAGDRGTSRTVTLSSGGKLTLSVSLDLLRLTATDRKFVFELIDRLEEYEQKGVQTGGGQ